MKKKKQKRKNALYILCDGFAFINIAIFLISVNTSEPFANYNYYFRTLFPGLNCKFILCAFINHFWMDLSFPLIGLDLNAHTLSKKYNKLFVL